MPTWVLKCDVFENGNLTTPNSKIFISIKIFMNCLIIDQKNSHCSTASCDALDKMMKTKALICTGNGVMHLMLSGRREARWRLPRFQGFIYFKSL